MTVDIYFDTDIRTVRKKPGTIYAALSAEDGGKSYWLPVVQSVTETAQGAAVKALHSVVAGDRAAGEHSISPYKGTRVVVHSTSGYITGSLYRLKSWASNGWTTAKGQPIAHKDEWQEINCNLAGNQLEIISERPESEALKRLKGAEND